MKILSTELAAHLDGEVTTLASCWKLKRRDGVVMGFTDHDTDITIGEALYVATTGMTSSAVSASNTLKVDELDIEGMLHSDAITQDDIMKGLYDYAEVEVFMTDYTAPDDGVLLLRTGWFGEVTMRGNQFVAEIRGLSQALQQPIGDIYSPGCRAMLGDARCGVELGTYTVAGVVSTAHDLYGVTASALVREDGYFTAGKITFTSGVNAGVSAEVKYYSDQRFYFMLPLREACEVGDTFTAIAGCDKTTIRCKALFDNIVNFRGEPHVPGTDRMLETSATRSTNW